MMLFITNNFDIFSPKLTATHSELVCCLSTRHPGNLHALSASQGISSEYSVDEIDPIRRQLGLSLVVLLGQIAFQKSFQSGMILITFRGCFKDTFGSKLCIN